MGLLCVWEGTLTALWMTLLIQLQNTLNILKDSTKPSTGKIATEACTLLINNYQGTLVSQEENVLHELTDATTMEISTSIQLPMNLLFSLTTMPT